MAYIPPHKRHSKDTTETPLPTPSLFVPSHHQRSNLEKKKDKGSLQGGKIVYAKNSIHRWFIVPLTDTNEVDDHDPCLIRLKPISCESIERKNGQKPLILVRDDHQQKEVNEITTSFAKSPWVSIVEKIQQDLLASFQNVRTEMSYDGPELIKPSFAVRFGKVFFHGSPSFSLDNINKSSAVETALCQLKRSYFTNIPDSFLEAILGEVISKIGVDFVHEKEYYHVKVFDKSRPHATISCKCSVSEAVGELNLCKIGLNEVRNLVVDISCLDKNLDLRMMLSTKRILTDLTDDEKQGLRSLIKSAVIDSEVKGGLRWPLGKESLGDRFVIVGAWHTKAKAFKNSSMRLQLRQADRFDFRTSTGEVTKEASLRMREINRQLRDQTMDLNPIMDMVSDTLKLVWDHFLCLEGSFS